MESLAFAALRNASAEALSHRLSVAVQPFAGRQLTHGLSRCFKSGSVELDH